MTAKVRKPTKGGYVIEVDGKMARLARVTTILEVVFKEAFGAMSYYGGRLALEYMAERDEVDDDIEDLYTAWKASPFDPNKTLRAASKRGTAAHKLFEDLCQRRATITGYAEPGHNPIIRRGDDPSFVAVDYDKGAAMAYVDMFQHLDAEEMLSEVKLYWTEHPIPECPDEICTHGWAGTADIIIPPFTLGDMKTNKGENRYSASVQMALYALAWEQMNPDADMIKRHFVIIPRPDGTYDLYDDPKQFIPSGVALDVYSLYLTRKEWGPVR